MDFDGEDDPYRPINWPFRKKLVTTLLYGLTTMGATWASSVYRYVFLGSCLDFGNGEEGKKEVGVRKGRKGELG